VTCVERQRNRSTRSSPALIGSTEQERSWLRRGFTTSNGRAGRRSGRPPRTKSWRRSPRSCDSTLAFRLPGAPPNCERIGLQRHHDLRLSPAPACQRDLAARVSRGGPVVRRGRGSGLVAAARRDRRRVLRRRRADRTRCRPGQGVAAGVRGLRGCRPASCTTRFGRPTAATARAPSDRRPQRRYERRVEDRCAGTLIR
jgi:hypothetical protein